MAARRTAIVVAIGIVVFGGAKRAVTLHGTDVRHPRSWQVTRAALGRIDLVAAVSEELAALVRDRRPDTEVAVLPTGVDLDRFQPLDRAQSRERLGLDAGAALALFPSDPERHEKRADLAREAADLAGAQLLALGRVPPDEVPHWVNAVDVVLVPSEREGFGLAVLEALACDVPVVATPVGVHAEALDGIAGTLCAPFDPDVWSAAIERHFALIAGRHLFRALDLTPTTSVPIDDPRQIVDVRRPKVVEMCCRGAGRASDRGQGSRIRYERLSRLDFAVASWSASGTVAHQRTRAARRSDVSIPVGV